MGSDFFQKLKEYIKFNYNLYRDIKLHRYKIILHYDYIYLLIIIIYIYNFSKIIIYTKYIIIIIIIIIFILIIAHLTSCRSGANNIDNIEAMSIDDIPS
jgi:hypothetical protein